MSDNTKFILSKCITAVIVAISTIVNVLLGTN